MSATLGQSNCRGGLDGMIRSTPDACGRPRLSQLDLGPPPMLQRAAGWTAFGLPDGVGAPGDFVMGGFGG